MIDTSKPLRTSRVEVSRLTRDTDPSKGTEWMKTNAFSPGLARMSSKTFSWVSYSESTPASPRGDSTVIGMEPPWDVCTHCGVRLSALRSGPGHAVAAGQAAHDGRTDRPGHRPVGRHIDPQPEDLLPPGPARRRDPVLGGDLLLRRDHQIVLRRGAQPAGERHLRTPARTAGSARPARSARSAPRSEASRRSPCWPDHGR